MEVGRTTGESKGDEGQPAEAKGRRLGDEMRSRQLGDEWGDINMTAG